MFYFWSDLEYNHWTTTHSKRKKKKKTMNTFWFGSLFGYMALF